MSGGQAFRFHESPRLAVSAGELARMIGVAESTVRAWMRDRGLPYCKVGCRVLIPLSLFEKWLLKHRADGAKELEAQVDQIVSAVLSGRTR
jgi:excisionase family DNA binding protein